jgi:NodT family efflux transporter outer membrane factor (OMF) lipoprotein
VASSQGGLQLSFGGTALRTRRSDNAFLEQPAGTRSNLFSLGFDASWELDVFGGIRRSVEAAEADLAAAQEDRRDVLVSLLGEVGRDWVEARGTLRRLVIARGALASQGDTANLTRARRDAGMASDLDVARAEALVSGTEATIPQLEAEFARATHALDVLLGRPPGAAQALLTGADNVPPPPPQVPVGLPSELLRRRPDVRRAERELAAAAARIGVAQAAEYPTFSLTGTAKLQSTETGTLFDAGSKTWSLGAGLDWPILQGGKLSAEVEAADARTEQALHAWEQTVLVALQESHDALVSYGREQERRASLAKAATSQRQAADLARQRHAAGLSDFLDVLDAERNELSAEDALAQSEVLLSSDAVALYKALGGGWTEEPEGGAAGEASADAAP